MIATPQQSLEAAAEVAKAAGVTPLLLGDGLEGEASEVWQDHGGNRDLSVTTPRSSPRRPLACCCRAARRR